MIVYRCEDKVKPTAGRNMESIYLTNWCGLPAPHEDGIRGFKPTYHHCGVETRRQLNVWWKPKVRKALIESGMQFVVLEVPDKHVLKGKKQVVFPRKVAKIVGVIGVNGRVIKVK